MAARAVRARAVEEIRRQLYNCEKDDEVMSYERNS